MILFFNEGDEPLEWILKESETKNGTWEISPSNGNLSRCEFGNITLSLDSTTLQARAEPHVSLFDLESSSLVDATRSAQIAIQAFVSATPSASQSTVILDLGNGSLVASSAVYFSVEPFDATGMSMLDAPDMALFAKLYHSSNPGVETGRCSVVYYQGECELPRLVTGLFMLRVEDNAGNPVGGGSSGRHSITVAKCPTTYSLVNDGMCACEAGSYDTGLECVNCPIGSISATAGVSECVACNTEDGETSNTKGTPVTRVLQITIGQPVTSASSVLARSTALKAARFQTGDCGKAIGGLTKTRPKYGRVRLGRLRAQMR